MQGQLQSKRDVEATEQNVRKKTSSKFLNELKRFWIHYFLKRKIKILRPKEQYSKFCLILGPFAASEGAQSYEFRACVRSFCFVCRSRLRSIYWLTLPEQQICGVNVIQSSSGD